MLLENWFGPINFLLALVAMILVVPKERIKSLAAFGLISGVGIAFALIYVMDGLLNFWEFRNADLFNLVGIPFFLSIAWVPTLIIFAHLLTQYRDFTLLGLVLLTFPAAATLIHYLMREIGMLTYHRWTLVQTFLVSLAIHLSLTAYLYLTGRLENVPLNDL